MANNAAEKMITLRSFDGEEFVVSETVAKTSQTIRLMMEVNCPQNIMPIVNVRGKILSMVIEYCKKHVIKNLTTAADASNLLSAEELKKWDENFIDVDQTVLYDILTAASYLNIKELVDLTCQKVADMIMGKTREEICQILNIKNDFTP